jgi:hypothetical protein
VIEVEKAEGRAGYDYIVMISEPIQRSRNRSKIRRRIVEPSQLLIPLSRNVLALCRCLPLIETGSLADLS